MELKEIIELKTVQAHEQSIFFSKVLENLMDEGSVLKRTSEPDLYAPTEKINHIIEELQILKENIETIDLLIISIHAPYKGCNSGEMLTMRVSGISIHAPYKGCNMWETTR